MIRQIALLTVALSLAFVAGYQYGTRKPLFLKPKSSITHSEALVESALTHSIVHFAQAKPAATMTPETTEKGLPEANPLEANEVQNIEPDQNPLISQGMAMMVTKGEIVSQSENEAGEIITAEQLPDGTAAERQYRKDGSMNSETLTYPNGEILTRNFFESGKIKVLFAQNTDQTHTSVLFDSTGVPTQRVIENPDGTKIYTEYDDHGVAKHTYEIEENGDSTLIK